MSCLYYHSPKNLKYNLQAAIAGFLMLLVCFAANAQAQTGTVQGKAVDMHDAPLAFVSVAIQNTTLGTTTDENGNFTIQNVPAGSQTLILSGLNIETVRQAILVSSQELLQVKLKGTDKSTNLQAVEITGRKEITYKNDVSFIGTRTATPLKDVPQAISYVTKEVMQDQQAFRTGDVVKNISGINQFSGYDDFTLRGFRSGSNQLLNGLRVSKGFWGQALTNNLERVEVIKGPASALFGNTDPGGTINRVTKKPLDIERQSVGFTVGSFNTYRSVADFTGPMNEDKTLLYRLNLGYENTETYRNLQGIQAFMIAPSISFLPTDKTQVNFDMVYNASRSKLDRGQPIFGAAAGTSLYSTPTNFAIARGNDYLNEDYLYVTSSLSHQFTSQLSFNASYMKFTGKEDLMEHRTSNSFAMDRKGKQIPTLMEMQTIRRKQQAFNDNVAAYLVYNFETGRLEHKLVGGYDYQQKVVPIGGSSQTARGYRTTDKTGWSPTYKAADSVSTKFERDKNGNPIPNVPHFDLTNPDYSIANTNAYFTTNAPIETTKYYSSAVYLQDQVKVGNLQVLLGLRQEFYYDFLNYKKDSEKKVKQTALIPRVGLVYSLSKQVNAYATYAQGYQPQSASVIGDPATYGGPFDPLTSKMLEGGFKTDWFDQRLTANLAVYQIEQNNLLVKGKDTDVMFEQRGQEVARGAELDVTGNILPNLSVTANYAYNLTKITKSKKEEEIGRIKENAPQHQGAVWVRYSVARGKLNGLGVGVGSNFVGIRNTFDTFLIENGKELGLKLPAYALLDAALFYNINKFQISMKVNNLTEKTHWTGGYGYTRLFPGAPRNYLMSVAYTF